MENSFDSDKPIVLSTKDLQPIQKLRYNKEQTKPVVESYGLDFEGLMPTQRVLTQAKNAEKAFVSSDAWVQLEHQKMVQGSYVDRLVKNEEEIPPFPVSEVKQSSYINKSGIDSDSYQKINVFSRNSLNSNQKLQTPNKTSENTPGNSEHISEQTKKLMLEKSLSSPNEPQFRIPGSDKTHPPPDLRKYNAHKNYHQSEVYLNKSTSTKPSQDPTDKPIVGGFPNLSTSTQNPFSVKSTSQNPVPLMSTPQNPIFVKTEPQNADIPLQSHIPVSISAQILKPPVPSKSLPHPKQALNLTIPKDTIKTPIQKWSPTTKLEKLSKFSSLLFDFLDFSKISGTDKLFSLFTTHSINPMATNTLCDLCQIDNNVKKLKCEHFLCSTCLIQSLQNDFDLQQLVCPVCKALISKYEESEIYKFCKTTKIELERHLLQKKLENSSKILCKVCEKLKKNYHKDSCLHVCIECQAALVRKGSESCPVCSVIWNIKSLESQSLNCDKCLEKCKFINGYAKYLHDEKCGLCIECVYSSLMNGVCVKCKERLKQVEKFEINDHLFLVCVACRKEVFRGEMGLTGCCKEMLCRACNERFSCPICGNNAD